MSRVAFLTMTLASALILSVPQLAVGSTDDGQRARAHGRSGGGNVSAPAGRTAVRRGSSPQSGAKSTARTSGGTSRRAPVTRTDGQVPRARPAPSSTGGTARPTSSAPSRRTPSTRERSRVTTVGQGPRSGGRVPPVEPVTQLTDASEPTRQRSPRGITQVPRDGASPTGSVRRRTGTPSTDATQPMTSGGRTSERRGPGRIVEVDGARESAPAGTDAVRVGSSTRGRAGTTPRAGSGTSSVAQRNRRPSEPANVVGRAVPRPPLSTSPGYSRRGGRDGYDRDVAGRGRGYRPGYRTTSTQRYRYPYDGGRVRFRRPAYGRYRHVRFPGYVQPRLHGSFFYFPGYSFNLGVGFGYPGIFGHYGYSGYAYHPYSYVGYTYQSGVNPYTGSLRLKVKPRDAQVLVDGYYVGLVDHFDGFSQRLRLEEGTYLIEIRHPEHLPIELDVLVVAGETVTYEDYLERR